MKDGPFKSVLVRIFPGWVVVSIGAFALFFFDSVSKPLAGLMLALGIATGICAMFHLTFALLGRLIFGSKNYRLLDVQVPRIDLFEDWAIMEPGNNLMVYFLVLVYMAVVGFAGLYIGINAASHSAFIGSEGRSAIDWLYFSVTTMATIGDSEIRPTSTWAQVAVIAQLSTGPLLLSWLIAVFASQGQPVGDGGHRHP